MDVANFVFVPLNTLSNPPAQAVSPPTSASAFFQPFQPSFFSPVTPSQSANGNQHIPSATLSHIEALLRLESSAPALVQAESLVEGSSTPRFLSPSGLSSATHSSSPSPTPRDPTSSGEGERYPAHLARVGPHPQLCPLCTTFAFSYFHRCF